MTRLIFTSPGFSDYAFVLFEGKTTVGRAQDNNLVIDDPSVSGHHCEILLHGREVIVRDSSTNGTWVDGSRLKGQTALHHGQRLRFGSVEARLEIPPPSFEAHDTELTAIHSLGRLKDKQLETPLSSVVLKPSSTDA